MSAEYEPESDPSIPEPSSASPGIGVALALAALAALGAGIAVSQLLDRRLSKPEIARLKF